MSSLLKKWIFPISITEFDSPAILRDPVPLDSTGCYGTPRSPSLEEYDDCSASLASDGSSPKVAEYSEDRPGTELGVGPPLNLTSPGCAANQVLEDEPEVWIESLRSCNTDLGTMLESLRIKISKSSKGWIRDFLEQSGFAILLETLDSLIEGSRHGADNLDTLGVQLECAKCLRTLVDTGQGLRFLAEDASPNLPSLLAKSLQTTNFAVKTLIYELLTALCLLNDSGRKLAFEVLQSLKEQVTCSRTRFAPIIHDLRDDTTPIGYKHTLLCFLNGLIMGVTDVRGRLKLRTELIGLGVTPIIYKLKLQSSEEIQYQCEIFEDQRVKDKDNTYGLDINDHQDLFQAIYQKVCETPNSAPFLAILQTLWQIDEGRSCDQIWDILETLTRKIVLMNDPSKGKFFVDNVIPYLPLARDGKPRNRDTAVQTENRFPPSSAVHYHRSFKGSVVAKKYQQQLIRRRPHHRSSRHLNEMARDDDIGVSSSSTSTTSNTARTTELRPDLQQQDTLCIPSLTSHVVQAKLCPPRADHTSSRDPQIVSEASWRIRDFLNKVPPVAIAGKIFHRSFSSDSLLESPVKIAIAAPRGIRDVLLPAKIEADIDRAVTPIPPPPPLPRPLSSTPLRSNPRQPNSGTVKRSGLGGKPYRTPNLTPQDDLAGLGAGKSPPPLPLPPWPPRTDNESGHSSGSGLSCSNEAFHNAMDTQQLNLLKKINKHAYDRLYSSPCHSSANEDESGTGAGTGTENVDIIPQALCVPRPKHRMKTLNWTKLPVSVVQSKDSIWNRVLTNSSYLKINYDEIEDLFSITSRDSPMKKRNSNSKDSSEIIFLEHKRSMNVNILLKQFKMPHNQIIGMIGDVDGKGIGADRLRGLLNILPDKNEVSLLKNYDSDSTKLGPAEQFYYQLIRIPNYSVLIKAMLLKEEFFDNVVVLKRQIDMVDKVCRELMLNQNLEKFLLLVLKIGNFFNANNYAGNAFGFKVSFLCKLMDTRSKTPRMTLLHYLLDVANSMDPNILDFPNELSALKSVQKLSIENLSLEINEMKRNVQKLGLEIEYSEEGIKNKFRGFVETALEKGGELKADIDKVQGFVKKLAERYCEDETKFNLQEFFVMFNNFCEKVTQARQENAQRKIIKENEAKRKARAQSTTFAGRGSKISLDEPENENMVEKLLAEIKKGDFRLQKRNSYGRSPIPSLQQQLPASSRDVVPVQGNRGCTNP